MIAPTRTRLAGPVLALLASMGGSRMRNPQIMSNCGARPSDHKLPDKNYGTKRKVTKAQRRARRRMAKASRKRNRAA